MKRTASSEASSWLLYCFLGVILCGIFGDLTVMLASAAAVVISSYFVLLFIHKLWG